MIVPSRAKIEKVLCKDPTKRVLQDPWLDVEGKTLLASTGQNAVLLPVQVEPGDVSGPVPVEAIKLARKMGVPLQCGVDYCIVQDGAAYPRGSFPAFPPIHRLIPQAIVTDEDLLRRYAEGIDRGEVMPVEELSDLLRRRSVEVSVNAKLLYETAQALDCEVLKLQIQDADQPIGVRPHPALPHLDGARAAVLPYRIERV